MLSNKKKERNSKGKREKNNKLNLNFCVKMVFLTSCLYFWNNGTSFDKTISTLSWRNTFETKYKLLGIIKSPQLSGRLATGKVPG